LLPGAAEMVEAYEGKEAADAFRKEAGEVDDSASGEHGKGGRTSAERGGSHPPESGEQEGADDGETGDGAGAAANASEDEDNNSALTHAASAGAPVPSATASPGPPSVTRGGARTGVGAVPAHENAAPSAAAASTAVEPPRIPAISSKGALHGGALQPDPVAESLRLYEERQRRLEATREAEQQQQAAAAAAAVATANSSRPDASHDGAGPELRSGSVTSGGPAQVAATEADVTAAALVPWWPRLREVCSLITGRAGGDYAKAAKAVRAALLRGRVAGPEDPVSDPATGRLLSGPLLMNAASQVMSAAAIRGELLPEGSLEVGSSARASHAGATESKESDLPSAPPSQSQVPSPSVDGIGDAEAEAAGTGMARGWSREAFARAREQALAEAMSMSETAGGTDSSILASAASEWAPGSSLPMASEGEVKPVSQLLQGDFKVLEWSHHV